VKIQLSNNHIASSDSSKRLDFVVKNLMYNLKVFELLPFETIDD
jgi:hypothetical protein